jgi:hypothetical protein
MDCRQDCAVSFRCSKVRLRLNNIYAGFKGAGAATPPQTEGRINAEMVENGPTCQSAVA